MTNKILLDKLQDCISFYKKNPGNPDLKEIVFSRLEFLDHQEFFEANVLYIGTLPRFQALYAPKLCFCSQKLPKLSLHSFHCLPAAAS